MVITLTIAGLSLALFAALLFGHLRSRGRVILINARSPKCKHGMHGCCDYTVECGCSCHQHKDVAA
jgi:hypothetical protein